MTNIKDKIINAFEKSDEYSCDCVFNEEEMQVLLKEYRDLLDEAFLKTNDFDIFIKIREIESFL